MKQTDDIAPLIDIAEREFSKLEGNAHAALIELHGFWTKLYGPNEALTPAFDALEEMRKEFLADDDVTAERSSGRSYNIVRDGAVIDRVDGALSARDAIGKFRVAQFGGTGWFVFTGDAKIESDNGTTYEAVQAGGTK